MISILATTAFFTAVMADHNQTWLIQFKLHPETLTTAKTELAALGGAKSCFELTENGTGYNLELAKHCKEVTDYELQCAGKDLEGLVTATEEEAKVETETGAEVAAADGRRLDKTAGASSEVEATEKETKVKSTEEGAEAVSEEKAALQAGWEAKKTQVYDANIKKFGALVSCIERNRYYSSIGNTSWLKKTYATLTCTEVLEKYGGGSCDNKLAKKYAINVCCPKTCATSKKLDCVAAKQEEIIEENKIGNKKENEVCESHSDCAANLQCGSEARPKLSTAPAEEKAEEVSAENTESTKNTEVVAIKDAETRRLEDGTAKDAAVEGAAVETVTEDAAVETVTEDAAPKATVAAQKKCQKAGASYYGFAFIAALLAVVSL